MTKFHSLLPICKRFLREPEPNIDWRGVELDLRGYPPAMLGRPRPRFLTGLVQLLRFSSRLIVDTERSKPLAIKLKLKPCVNCVCINARSSILNCLYLFFMQHFLLKIVALQF